MTETLGIVRGRTLYGMGDLMIASLAAILHKRGYETLDFEGARLERDLATLKRAEVGAIVAYNGMLVDASVAQGMSVWDDAGIPCIAWLVDHPIYHLWRLRGGSRLFVAACIDESHARFLSDWGVKPSLAFTVLSAPRCAAPIVMPLSRKNGDHGRFLRPRHLGAPFAFRDHGLRERGELRPLLAQFVDRAHDPFRPSPRGHRAGGSSGPRRL